MSGKRHDRGADDTLGPAQNGEDIYVLRKFIYVGESCMILEGVQLPSGSWDVSLMVE